jgi:hypothetical protein
LELSTDAGGVLIRIRRVLLMDADAAMDRFVGPYARSVVAHPVLIGLGNIALGGVIAVVGRLVLHSTFLVILGLVFIGLATLFACVRVIATL